MVDVKGLDISLTSKRYEAGNTYDDTLRDSILFLETDVMVTVHDQEGIHTVVGVDLYFKMKNLVDSGYSDEKFLDLYEYVGVCNIRVSGKIRITVHRPDDLKTLPKISEYMLLSVVL